MPPQDKSASMRASFYYITFYVSQNVVDECIKGHPDDVSRRTQLLVEVTLLALQNPIIAELDTYREQHAAQFDYGSGSHGEGH
jgi:hypothetical protein